MNNTNINNSFYIVCKDCKTKYPATTKYVHRKKDNKTGFRTKCKFCRSKEQARYTKAHPYKSKIFTKEQIERRNERSRKYYHENRKNILEKKKKYRKTDNYKEQRQRYSRNYYIKNRNKLKNYALEYRKTDTGKLKESISSHKRKAKTKQLPNDLSMKEWKRCLEYFGYSCAYCGRKTEILQKEHVIPLSKNGGFTKKNIIPACRECNYSKHTHVMEKWYKNWIYYDCGRFEKIKEYIN